MTTSCSQLRLRWKEMLTGGVLDREDADVAAALAQADAEARQLWQTMRPEASPQLPWNDLTEMRYEIGVYTAYVRLKKLALAYSMMGGELAGNPELLDDLKSALDGLYRHHYNERSCGNYTLWWHAEIGIPLEAGDCLVLLHRHMPASAIERYARAILRCSPDPVHYHYRSLEHQGTRPSTGANRVWKVAVHAIVGALTDKRDMMDAARSALAPVFRFVENGDGFYKDGSFIQHQHFPYNGGYGKSLLELTGRLMRWWQGTEWGLRDEEKECIRHWIDHSFIPLIFKGALMDMCRGREIAREQSQNHRSGHDVIEAILEVAGSLPESATANWKRIIAYWIEADTYRRFYSHARPGTIVQAKRLEVASEPAFAPAPLFKVYANMDRAVLTRREFAFAISMSSTRIAAYECISKVNRKGWYTAAGMSQLYTNDLGQYSGDYWATADLSRLPGITKSSGRLPDEFGAGSFGASGWAGGAELDGAMGTVGMEYTGLAPSMTYEGSACGDRTMAKKSWFVFDDHIVCIGSGISSGEGVVETIVDHRRLTDWRVQQLSVNGEYLTARPDWERQLPSVQSVHLQGEHPDAGIGYHFPSGCKLQASIETRTGRWSDIGTGSETPRTGTFLTLAIDHGTCPAGESYLYVLYPAVSPAQFAERIAKSAVDVLECSEEAHAVRHAGLGLTGLNVWTDRTVTIGGVTCSARASLIIREDPKEMRIAIADPTQLNDGSIAIELDRSAVSVRWADPQIEVHQLSPVVKATVRVAGSRGRSFVVILELNR